MTILHLTNPHNHLSQKHTASIFYLYNWSSLGSFTKNLIGQKIPSLSADSDVKLVLVDSTHILSMKHLQLAIYNALFPAKSQKALKTLQTQILYNLSDSKNISASLKTFGAKEKECFLVAFRTADNEMPPAVDRAQVEKWIQEEQELTQSTEPLPQIVEDMHSMDDFLKKNGSQEWIRENLLSNIPLERVLSRDMMESILLTQLSIKDL